MNKLEMKYEKYCQTFTIMMMIMMIMKKGQLKIFFGLLTIHNGTNESFLSLKSSRTVCIFKILEFKSNDVSLNLSS